MNLNKIGLSELLDALQKSQNIKCSSNVMPPACSRLSKTCMAFTLEICGKCIVFYLSKERLFNPNGSEIGGEYHHEKEFVWIALSRGKQRARQTIVHELAHVLQDAFKGWPPETKGSLSNEEQIRLYEKYYYRFDDHYASLNDVEAAAEVFRALFNFKEQDELWAHNPDLLADYGAYWNGILQKLLC